MEIIFALIIILCTTIGQILLKKGALAVGKLTIYRFIIFGYIFFVLAVIFSYALMKIIPMKYYTVVMSINYITVLIGANIFLNEKINKEKVIGTTLVAIGIIIFLYKG